MWELFSFEIPAQIIEFGPTFLVLLPFMLFPIGIALYFFLKYRKGTIKITMLQTNYNYGDKIAGSFILHAKKTIVGEDLSVHLICQKKETTTRNGKRQVKWVHFKKYTHNIAQRMTYEPGLRREHDIQIKIPSYQEVFWDPIRPDLWDSIFWNIAEKFIKNITHGEYRWQISVLLLAEWLDIGKVSKISVSPRVWVDVEDPYPSGRE